MHWDSIIDTIAITGAVGTASMGFVEALKVVTLPVGRGSLATVGLGKVKRNLGRPAISALALVYGAGASTVLLDGAWRKGAENLATTLRNGLRMAVFADLPDLDAFVRSFGQDPAQISEAVKRLREGDGAKPGALDPAIARERVARLEAAIDARVDGAVASGRDAYVSGMQIAAMVVSVGGTLLVALTDCLPPNARLGVGDAILLGLLAVPVAPVAKDVVTFLNGLRTSLSGRGARA